jgi:hypothetical protein
VGLDLHRAQPPEALPERARGDGVRRAGDPAAPPTVRPRARNGFCEPRRWGPVACGRSSRLLPTASVSLTRTDS